MGLPAVQRKPGNEAIDRRCAARPCFVASPVHPYAGYPTDQTVGQAILPYPQFYGVNDFFAYNAGSNYNALQVTVTKHLTKGFGFLAAYTYSKTIGYQDSLGAMGYGTPQDFYNRGLERSVASFNFPQAFKLTWNWDIPVGRGHKADLGWANAILGGWQLSGIHNYIAGGPIALGSSGLSTPSGFGNIRPDVLGTAGSLSNGGIGTADWSVPTQWLKAVPIRQRSHQSQWRSTPGGNGAQEHELPVGSKDVKRDPSCVEGVQLRSREG